MKVLTEFHNFLLSPSFYCLLSMRRILNRAFEEKTLSSREKKLLAEVRRRLDGQLDPNWRANWLTFQRITELESDRTNSIELPRSSPRFSHSRSALSKPPRCSLLRRQCRRLPEPVRSLQTQHRHRRRRQFSSNSPGRSKRSLLAFLQFFNYKTKGSALQHLYFFCHEGTEQQNYFAELQVESDGFKKLLKERDRMIHLQTWKTKSLSSLSRSLPGLPFPRTSLLLRLRANSLRPRPPLSSIPANSKPPSRLRSTPTASNSSQPR